MLKIVLLLILLAAHGASDAAGQLPMDVRVFVKNADLCEHMAGEWDSELPKKEMRDIERGITKYCAPARQQLRILQKKYQAYPAVLKAISKHAYDSVKDYSENFGS